MLFKIIFQALISAAFSFAPLSTDTFAEDEHSIHESQDHVATFELPSFENFIEPNTTEEVIPVINLPEVEIKATYTGKNKYEAIVLDGEIVPVIYLDEVIITPQS